MEEDWRSVGVRSMEEEIKLPRHEGHRRIRESVFFFLFYFF